LEDSMDKSRKVPILHALLLPNHKSAALPAQEGQQSDLFPSITGACAFAPCTPSFPISQPIPTLSSKAPTTPFSSYTASHLKLIISHPIQQGSQSTPFLILNNKDPTTHFASYTASHLKLTIAHPTHSKSLQLTISPPTQQGSLNSPFLLCPES
jgi:hypothetical protein